MTEQLVRIRLRQNDTQRATVSFPDFRDGTRLGIRARYSAHDALWRLWYLDLDGSTIAGPRTLVPGVDLFAGHRHDPRIPRGQLFCYSDDRQPPNAETLGVTAHVFYRSAS